MELLRALSLEVMTIENSHLIAGGHFRNIPINPFHY